MKDIRIAAVMMNCPVGRTRDNLDRMAGWVAAAKKRGADFICFPEMNVTGYSTRVGIRDSAQSVPGPISQTILETAPAISSLMAPPRFITTLCTTASSWM